VTVGPIAIVASSIRSRWPRSHRSASTIRQRPIMRQLEVPAHGDTHSEYTVLRDPVNVAQRPQAVSKSVGATLVVSKTSSRP
jgi:class 3 adenylate cyclase